MPFARIQYDGQLHLMSQYKMNSTINGIKQEKKTTNKCEIHLYIDAVNVYRIRSFLFSGFSLFQCSDFQLVSFLFLLNVCKYADFFRQSIEDKPNLLLLFLKPLETL